MAEFVMRAIPQLFYDFIEGAEALRLTVYLDSGGRPTGGYGHLCPDLKPGDEITKQTADLWLREDAVRAQVRAYGVMSWRAINAMTAHEWAAILSFIFNCGATKGDRIWKIVNAQKFDAAPGALMAYTHVHEGGKLVEVPGLEHRRMAEIALWKTPDVAAAVAVVQPVKELVPASSVTRDAVTPPVVAAKPIHQDGPFVTALGAAALSAPKLVQQASDAVNKTSAIIQPYADHSDKVAHVVTALATGGAALAVASAGALWLRSKYEARHG